MGTQQDFHVMQLLQLLMGDGLEPAVGKTVHLGGIVYDIAQTVEMPTLVEFLFGLADGGRHTKAESRPLVNLDDSHF